MDTFTLFLIVFPLTFGALMLLKYHSDKNFGTAEQRAAELYGYAPEPEPEPEPAPAPRRQPARPADHAAMITPAQPVYAVPAPIQPAAPAIRVLSFGDTITALVNSLHLLLVGETEAGKSTAAQAVLVGRVKAGDQVVILDPHADPSDWNGVAAIGTGRNYGAIGQAMGQLLTEMTSRYQRKALGDTSYARLSVFVDEWPAIQTHCKNAGQFMTELAQEGRKVGMRLVILTQSDRVESLGIQGKGDVRANFTSLLLGSKATESLPAVATMARPAAIRHGATTAGATVDGFDRYRHVQITPSSIYPLVSIIPEVQGPPAPVSEVIDFDAEAAYWLGGTSGTGAPAVPPVHAQNQPNHRPEPPAEPVRAPLQTAAEPPAEPPIAPALLAELEAAYIEKCLTQGMSANTIAAKLGGTRATRLAQIRAVKESMQTTSSEPAEQPAEHPTRQAVAA